MTNKQNIGEKNMKAFISLVEIIEGNLYELMGEDSKIFVFDSFIRVISDGEVYDHKHIFKGSFVDEDGINRPDMGACCSAVNLLDKIGIVLVICLNWKKMLIKHLKKHGLIIYNVGMA
jgi:hypothetical protein